MPQDQSSRLRVCWQWEWRARGQPADSVLPCKTERAETSCRRGHKAATDPQHTGCPQSTSLPLYPSAAPEVRLMTSKLFFGRSLGFLQRDGPVILSCTYFCFVSKVTRIVQHENMRTKSEG